MKKILTFILTAAVAFSCMTAPAQKAEAVSDGDTCTDYWGEYTYKDGYWTRQYDEGNKYGYTKIRLYSAYEDGTKGFSAGCVWYDKDGSVVFKIINGEVLVDSREGYDDGVYIDDGGDEYTYKDGYCQKYAYINSDGYAVMYIYDTAKEDMHDGFDSGSYIGEMWYDNDGNIVYHVISHSYPDKDEVLVDKRKIDAEIKMDDTVTESQTIVACCGESGSAPLSDTDVIWSSSNTNVATIDKVGVITGKKPGKTTITATIKANGQKLTKKLTVVKNQFKKSVPAGGGTVYYTVYYNAKGNLVWKVQLKSTTKKKWNYAIDSELNLFNDTVKKIHWVFTTKDKKTRTKTYTIKKADAKGFDLTKNCSISPWVWSSDTIKF